MPAQLGKIYVAPSGAQLIVTKGGPGTRSDGDTPLALQDAGADFPPGTAMVLKDAKPLPSSD